jgi:hypothetical protein
VGREFAVKLQENLVTLSLTLQLNPAGISSRGLKQNQQEICAEDQNLGLIIGLKKVLSSRQCSSSF